MRKSDFYYNSQSSHSCTKYITLLILLIFCFTVTTFTFLEIGNFYSDEAEVKKILKDSFKSLESKPPSANTNEHTFPFNLEQQNEQKVQENSERSARAAAAENKTISSLAHKTNSYYEEQRPVVVYSKTDYESPIAQRQMADIPPKQDTGEEDPYNKVYDGDYGSNDDDDDYFGQPEEKSSQDFSYYRQPPNRQFQSYSGQQTETNYDTQPQTSYRKTSLSSHEEPGEEFAGTEIRQSNSEEARASQYHNSGNYYRQYPYASPPTAALAGRENNKRLPGMENPANRNMQLATRNQAQQQQYRNSYPSYADDYDYQQPNSHYPSASQSLYNNRNSPPQRPQYRTPTTPAPPEEKQEADNQMDFLTMFKSLKTMWDLYQSFTTSWNTIAERRNREEELARQKYKQQQQQMRINSKKPPRFNTRRNTTNTMKNPRKPLNNTLTTTTTIAPLAAEMPFSAEDEVADSIKKLPPSKNEPRKGTKLRTKTEENLRDKRQAAGDSKSVSQGRYIKGDPLKGYYDFVITEGSYKFWAVFQVGTAILIIYSTFAAIYYSKVNPLVSDYDYTDYLGGARSLSGGDADFIDDDDEMTGQQKSQPKNWLEWLPRTGHSLQFILEAIDKLPTDHAGEKGENNFMNTENEEEKEDPTFEEHMKSESEEEKGTENSNEMEDINGGQENSVENESLDAAREENEAM